MITERNQTDPLLPYGIEFISLEFTTIKIILAVLEFLI